MIRAGFGLVVLLVLVGVSQVSPSVDAAIGWVLGGVCVLAVVWAWLDESRRQHAAVRARVAAAEEAHRRSQPAESGDRG